MDQQTGPGTEQPGRTRSLYRKYRPMTFDEDEFVGQEHISRTLRNAITQGRIAHAYLFCGPRGTGKTAVMNVITGHAASEHGAVVLRWTAGGPPGAGVSGGPSPRARRRRAP